MAWKPWLWPGFRELGLDKSQAQALSPSQPKPHPARAQAAACILKRRFIQKRDPNTTQQLSDTNFSAIEYWPFIVSKIQRTLVSLCVVLVLPLIIHSRLASHPASPSRTSPYNPFTSPHEQQLYSAGCRTIVKVTQLLGDSGRVSTHANDE